MQSAVVRQGTLACEQLLMERLPASSLPRDVVRRGCAAQSSPYTITEIESKSEFEFGCFLHLNEIISNNLIIELANVKFVE